MVQLSTPWGDPSPGNGPPVRRFLSNYFDLLFGFLYAVLALANGSLRIVSNTLVIIAVFTCGTGTGDRKPCGWSNNHNQCNGWQRTREKRRKCSNYCTNWILRILQVMYDFADCKKVAVWTVSELYFLTTRINTMLRRRNVSRVTTCDELCRFDEWRRSALHYYERGPVLDLGMTADRNYAILRLLYRKLM